jgi:hypothetical protein
MAEACGNPQGYTAPGEQDPQLAEETESMPTHSPHMQLGRGLKEGGPFPCLVPSPEAEGKLAWPTHLYNSLPDGDWHLHYELLC